MALTLRYLLALLCFATLSLQDTKDPVKNFCRRWGHQTAVIDRKLYIDGGQVDWNPISQNPLNYTNTWLLYNDLNTQVPGSDLGMPQLYANLSKNSTIPSVSGGVLWADEVNKIFYLYGGEFTTDSPTDYSLFGYDTILNQWNSSANTPSDILRVAWGAGVGVNDRAEGYYLGGWLSNMSVPGWSGPPIATSTLIKYDMIADTWTNNTGPDGTGRAEGVMVYLPASDGGLLIYFGGVLWSPDGTVTGSNMSEIYIFDIASEKWYTQTATGDVPENRRKFCAGATWAQDRSSYNIYLYGGQGITNVTGFDDVYILTLPSFQWIKWYPRQPGAGNPHGLESCNVVSNSQMLVIGGWFNQHQDCDSPNVWGTHNLNLGEDGPNNAAWDLYWPNVTQYFVPPEIVAKIGGGPTGGATNLQPQSDWDNRDLPVYFSRTPSFAVREPTRSIPTPTSTITGSSNSTSSHHSNHIGAIVGGAVGGAVGLFILLGVVWCCLRRSSDSNAPVEVTEEAKPEQPRVELPTIPPQELPSLEAHDPWKDNSHAMTSVYSHSRSTSHPGSPAHSPQATSTAEGTPVPTYPSPMSPPQARYGNGSPPLSAYPTGIYPPNTYPAETYGSQYNQPSPPSNPQYQNNPYDHAQFAHNLQHYPPPTGVHMNPHPDSSPNTTSYFEDQHPPTASSTPAHFYPQPLTVQRRPTANRQTNSPSPPSRGKFVEQDFH